MVKIIEEKVNKKLRISNYIFSLLMISATIGFIIYYLITDNTFQVTRNLSVIALAPLIYVLELIFKRRVSDFVLTFYNIYIFLGSFLGTVINFYLILPHYDDFMHTLFGYVGCIIGLYILIKLSNYKNMSMIFVMIMTMFVSMGCASFWKIGEYFCDKVFGASAQGGLDDTMWDIIDTLIGSIVFQIHFLIHKNTDKNLIMGNIIEDFSNN